MTTTLAVVITMVVLTAAGALPVRMLAGWRPAAPFMAPIGGAVLAGTAGELTVLVDGTELGWFVPLAIGVNAAATASWLARREARRARTAPRPNPWLWILGGAGVLGVAAAAAWSLRSMVSSGLSLTARSIWLPRASWIADGHTTALSTLRNHGLSAAHTGYPTLASASVALGWLITGLTNDRSGQLVIALLTGCAAAAMGATVLQVALVASERSVGRHSAWVRAVLAIVGGAAAAALVLFAFHLGGAGAINGSVDLFAAGCAVAAGGLGLVLPIGAEHARAAAVLAVAAGLTSYEGIGAAIVVFVLIGARWLTASNPIARNREGRMLRRHALIAVTACAIGIGGVIIWSIGAALRRATPNSYLNGPRIGSIFSRIEATWDAMIGQLHLAGVTLLIGIFATVLLGRLRRRLGFGSDAWIWILGIVEVVLASGYYVIGNPQVQAWLAQNAHVSALFAECLGVALVAWWCVIGVAVAMVRHPAGEGSHVDGAAPEVLDRAS